MEGVNSMVYSVIIHIPTLNMDISIDYPYTSNGNMELDRIIRMYKGKHIFRDPRMQGYKGNCKAIMRIYPDMHNELLYNNGWERELNG